MEKKKQFQITNQIQKQSQANPNINTTRVSGEPIPVEESQRDSEKPSDKEATGVKAPGDKLSVSITESYSCQSSMIMNYFAIGPSI